MQNTKYKIRNTLLQNTVVFVYTFDSSSPIPTSQQKYKMQNTKHINKKCKIREREKLQIIRRKTHNYKVQWSLFRL